MPLPMLADFAVRFAGGLSALLLLTSWRDVPLAFFRTHCQVILGLNVLAGLALGRSDASSWTFWAAVALAVVSFVATIGWGLGLLRIGVPALWMLVGLSLAILIGPLPASGFELYVLNGASRAASAFLLGATMTAMLLGHHYLTAPAMSIDPLVKYVRCMAVGLVVRIILAVVALGFLATRSGPPIPAMFVAVRWGMGFAATVLATALAWQTVRIRSTQSATGILYVDISLMLFGELTSMILAGPDGVLI